MTCNDQFCQKADRQKLNSEEQTKHRIIKESAFMQMKVVGFRQEQSRRSPSDGEARQGEQTEGEGEQSEGSEQMLRTLTVTGEEIDRCQSRNPLKNLVKPYLETPCILGWCSTGISETRHLAKQPAQG